MRVVLTYGSFDLLHYGHLNLLRRAKSFGDKLVIGLSTDEFNLLEKHKRNVQSYQLRKENLEAIRYVDLVIPEISWEQKRKDIQKYNAEIFLMGDDWAGKFDFLSEHCKVIYLPRTPHISSTLLRTQVLTTPAEV